MDFFPVALLSFAACLKAGSWELPLFPQVGPFICSELNATFTMLHFRPPWSVTKTLAFIKMEKTFDWNLFVDCIFCYMEEVSSNISKTKLLSFSMYSWFIIRKKRVWVHILYFCCEHTENVVWLSCISLPQLAVCSLFLYLLQFLSPFSSKKDSWKHIIFLPNIF